MPQHVIETSAFPWHAIKHDTGAVFVFCGEKCLVNYTMATEQDDETYAQIIVAPSFECISCYWCGNLFYYPTGNCFHHHPNSCETWQWRHTHQAVQAINVLNILFNGDIPEEIMLEVEDLAGGYGPHVDGATIANAAYATWNMF